MNILYCGDSNTERGIFLSLLSLMDHNREKLHIYILTMNLEYQGRRYRAISEEYIHSAEAYIKNINIRNTIRLFDVSDCFARCMPEKNMKTRFTPYCMLRLYADYIAEIPERILYLDNDVLCRGDITDFYYQDMHGYELAGALDYYGSWFFRRTIWCRDYMNSGVLLLNMDEIRKTGLFERSRTFCKNKQMFMPDQSAINKLAGTKKLVERKYNEQRRLHKNTVLQHFTTSFRLFPWLHTVAVKPWEIEKVHHVLKLHEYDDVFEKFQKAGLFFTDS